MSIDEGYPQPTTEELEAEETLYLSFNPYWWKIAQGKLGELANEELWDSYTEEIDQGITRLMQEMEIPVTWVHTVDFRAIDDGWVLQGSRGVWVAGTGWQQTSFGTQRGVEIERTITECSISGMLIQVSVNSNTSNQVYIKIESPALDLYNNIAEATAAFKDIRVDGLWEGVTKIKLGALNPGLLGSYVIRHFVAWGHGDNPFS